MVMRYAHLAPDAGEHSTVERLIQLPPKLPPCFGCRKGSKWIGAK
jgi:hypothetical protein